MTLELQVVGDPIIASAGASFVVPVRLRNVGSKPETLMFNSSCSFQVAIATLDGRELARPDPICLSVIREPTLDPGEALQNSVAYTMGEPGVVPLAPGVYRITPILLAISKHAVGTQTVRLEIRSAKPTDPSMEQSRP